MVELAGSLGVVAEGVSVVEAGLCFFFAVLGVAIASGTGFTAPLAEVSVPLAFAEGAAAVVDGDVAVVAAVAAAPLGGLLAGAMDWSGVGCARAAGAAAPAGVVWAKAAGAKVRATAAAPAKSVLSFMLGFLVDLHPPIGS